MILWVWLIPFSITTLLRYEMFSGLNLLKCYIFIIWINCSDSSLQMIFDLDLKKTSVDIV